MEKIISIFQNRKQKELAPQKSLNKPAENGIEKNLVALLQPNSFEAEQYNMLMTNLLHGKRNTVPQVIMVTSSDINEGKSLTAANLAISIARNTEKKVLLIDCDLRLPTIHKLFGLGDVPGLSEYLSRNIPLAPLLKKHKLDRLTILPAGSPPENPFKLLSKEKMTKLINWFTERYKDLIIILDTAPPQITSESNTVSKFSDGIILVANQGSTRMEALNELVDMLGREKLLGVIMNRFKQRLKKTYGNYKYQKYYRKAG